MNVILDTMIVFEYRDSNANFLIDILSLNLQKG